MRRLKAFLKSEKGAAQLIEATILYPVAFMVIFLMIYIGLYILQIMTVSSYAQKVAILSAREVSCPGYHTIVASDRYSTAATEIGFDTSGEKAYKGQITIENHIENVKLRAYRYWSKDPLNQEEKDYYTEVLTNLVTKNSFLKGDEGQPVKVTISCKNYAISQFITVKVEQQMMDFAVLKYFGIESPKISVTAVSTVSDTDELVRTTDFVVDAIETIAEKCGIDTKKIKTTVKGALSKLGLS